MWKDARKLCLQELYEMRSVIEVRIDNGKIYYRIKKAPRQRNAKAHKTKYTV